MADATIEQVRRKAIACGMVLRDFGKGHLRVLVGPVNVDYWPKSKKRTVYCKDTMERAHNCTPDDFIQFAVKQKDLFEQGVCRATKVKEIKKRKRRKRKSSNSGRQ